MDNILIPILKSIIGIVSLASILYLLMIISKGIRFNFITQFPLFCLIGDGIVAKYILNKTKKDW